MASCSPDEKFAQGAFGCSILLKFLRVRKLQQSICRYVINRLEKYAAHLKVHIVICADKVAFVLQCPLQADVDMFSNKALQKRFGVHRLHL